MLSWTPCEWNKKKLRTECQKPDPGNESPFLISSIATFHSIHSFFPLRSSFFHKCYPSCFFRSFQFLSRFFLVHYFPSLPYPVSHKFRNAFNVLNTGHDPLGDQKRTLRSNLTSADKRASLMVGPFVVVTKLRVRAFDV